MAAPGVVGRTHYDYATPASSYSPSIGTPIEGNLGILAISARNDADNTAVYTTPTGWTELENAVSAGTNRGLRGLWIKVMAASETSPVVIANTPADAQEAEVVFIEIDNWFGTLAGVEHTSSDFDNVPAASAFTAPAITPSWGAEDTLFIIGTLCVDDESSVTVWPTGYTTNGSSQNNSGGVNGSAMIGTSYRDAAVTTETPGEATLSENEGVAEFTIAIRSLVAVPARSYRRHIGFHYG